MRRYLTKIPIHPLCIKLKACLWLVGDNNRLHQTQIYSPHRDSMCDTINLERQNLKMHAMNRGKLCRGEHLVPEQIAVGDPECQ